MDLPSPPLASGEVSDEPEEGPVPEETLEDSSIDTTYQVKPQGMICEQSDER